jgi:arginine decarboxylase
MERWTVEDAAELYCVPGWGLGLFGVNAAGHVVVRANDSEIDLKLLTDDLVARGIEPPILIRLTDVLRARIDALALAFRRAIEGEEYRGRFRGVFPIKVNQQRHVVEAVVRLSRPHHLGLECGSKPELMVVLAEMDDPEALIICNGYKDAEYIEMAMIARKLGRNCVIVIEQPDELEQVLSIADRLGISPLLGLRAKLDSPGAGRWKASAGPGSKFGLNAEDLVGTVSRLREAGELAGLRLLHYHLGSQISSIRRIRDAIHEAARTYVELRRLGAPMGILDVGGGLGIDYDGSRTDFASSMNYDLDEYARTVVTTTAQVCDDTGFEHPDIVTESGRATVAHSSVLVTPVLGVSQRPQEVAGPLAELRSDAIDELIEIEGSISGRNPLEVWHRASAVRDRTSQLFSLGISNLEERAAVEARLWSIGRKLLRRFGEEELPEDLESLPRQLADTCYCNFSVFQSVPDSWAVSQIFPVVPLARLDERPTRRAILADLTCDSDGKIDRFADLRDIKYALEVHDQVPGQPYYLGIFLVGAYQEILGDLHNLFGDTNAVHVSSAPTARGYRVDSFVEGDRVSEVLRYVQYDHEALLDRLRNAVERAIDAGSLEVDEGARLLRNYRQGLAGYTYLE